MSRPPVFTDRQVRELRQQYKTSSLATLAQRHCVSADTVADTLRRAGVTIRRRGRRRGSGRKIPDDQLGKLREKYTSGASLHQLTIQYQVSLSTLKEALRRAGVSPRKNIRIAIEKDVIAMLRQVATRKNVPIREALRQLVEHELRAYSTEAP